jgi:hypothetical protein
MDGMKIRYDFVTNSSSSCFICQISGRKESGMDMSREEARMKYCVNGHTFGNEYLLEDKLSEQDMLDALIEKSKEDYEKYLGWSERSPEREDIKQWAEDEKKHIEELESADSIEGFEDEYDKLADEDGVSSKACPICQFQCGIAEDLLAYLLKEQKINKDDVLAVIKEVFGSYTNFMEYLRS